MSKRGLAGMIDADLDAPSRALRTEWRWLAVVDIAAGTDGLCITVREVGPGVEGGDFRFVWPSFHAYGARNESFIEIEPRGEDDKGAFREVFGAPFLAYANASTWREEGLTLRHWQIAGADLVVDVASVEPPTVRFLGRGA